MNSLNEDRNRVNLKELLEKGERFSVRENGLYYGSKELQERVKGIRAVSGDSEEGQSEGCNHWAFSKTECNHWSWADG